MLQAIVQSTCIKDAYRVPVPVWPDGTAADFLCFGYGEHSARKGLQLDHAEDDFWTVILYESGQGKVWSEKQKSPFVLGPGDVFVLRPHGRYHREESSEKLSKYRWLALSGARAGEVLATLQLPADRVLYRPGLVRKLQPLFDDMRIVLDKADAPMAEVCELGWRFARVVQPAPAPAPVIEGGGDTQNMRGKAAVEWLRTHYPEGCMVQDLIKVMGVSSATLTRLFHQYTGQSPKVYLDHLRLEHAKRLLTRGGYTSKEIAERCGYRDHRHFAQAFTRTTGVSPQVWGRQAG